MKIKNKIILVAVLILSLRSYSQTSAVDLNPLIERNFDYKNVEKTNCDSVPIGIYSISFTLNRRYQMQKIVEKDSLSLLHRLFINSIKDALDSLPSQIKKELIGKKLVQLVFFYNIECKNDDARIDSLSSDASVRQYIMEELQNMLSSIEQSFRKIKNDPIYGKNVFYLPMVTIKRKPSSGYKYRPIDILIKNGG